MRAVDDVILARLRAVLPPIDNTDTGIQNEPRVHDGLVKADNTTKIVSYALPYVVYTSNIGPDDEDSRRLAGRRTRRSVLWSIMYVGLSRNQAKWAGERVRMQLADRRIPVPGHKTWMCRVESSQRVRRDDDMIRPDGSPLFYGVDEYAMTIALSEFPAPVGVAP